MRTEIAANGHQVTIKTWDGYYNGKPTHVGDAYCEDCHAKLNWNPARPDTLRRKVREHK
jgi:hypothetical protein